MQRRGGMEDEEANLLNSDDPLITHGYEVCSARPPLQSACFLLRARRALQTTFGAVFCHFTTLKQRFAAEDFSNGSTAFQQEPRHVRARALVQKQGVLDVHASTDGRGSV